MDARFGINAQGVFRLTPDRWDAHLASIARLDVGHVRVEANWDDAEHGGPGPYTWAKHDLRIRAMAGHGLRWYALMAYSAPWAGVSGWLSPPAEPERYAAYVGAMADRYRAGGAFWTENPDVAVLPPVAYEIWNEPNLPRYWPDQIDAPERYADLYLAAHNAIRRADPVAEIIVGGLSPSGTRPADWIARMVAHRPELAGIISTVAFHPYGDGGTLTATRIRALRAAMDANGLRSARIEITEAGWAAPPTTETTRASLLRGLVGALDSMGVTRFAPYTWLTPELGRGPEDYFGIANQDATWKPSASAYAAAIRA